MRRLWPVLLLPLLAACPKSTLPPFAADAGDQKYVQMFSTGSPSWFLLKKDKTFEVNMAGAKADGTYRIIDSQLELTYKNLDGKPVPAGTKPALMKFDGEIIDMSDKHAEGDLFKFKRQR